MSTLAITSAATTARTFVDAVVTRDHGVLREVLTEDVWFRSLLPRGLVEHHDRAAALETIHGWFGTAPEVRLLSRYHHGAGGREHVGWRLLLRPDWAPEVWHLIEQIGYVRVADGRVRRVDLVCTGFQPLAGFAPTDAGTHLRV